MELEYLVQQLITGFSNGMIIALIALGYTMVYGIIELINFAHGDLFMLGSFMALTLVGAFGLEPQQTNSFLYVIILLATVAPFCAGLNWLVDRLAYRHLRNAPRLAPLVSAIGVSFIFLNLGLFWGGLPMQVFGHGRAAAAPKDFPALVTGDNIMATDTAREIFGDVSIFISPRELMVFLITVPLMLALTWYVKRTRNGRAMRAVAQDPVAAKLMGVDVDRVIGLTFIIGGALAGVASVVYSLYNNTIYFQMGFRAGLDAFTAAVLGGIGNLPGAVLGGLLIGVLRALSDTYIATQWTNSVVFSILILTLVFRPTGLLGANLREKV